MFTRREALFLAAGAAASTLAPSAATAVEVAASPPPISAWVVGTPGEFDWQFQVGKTAEEATKILHDAGFVNVKVVLDNGTDATDADKTKLVVGVNPAEGSAVVGTTQIVLTVESGTTDGNG